MKKLTILALYCLCLCACMLQNEDQGSGLAIRLVPVSTAAALGKVATAASVSGDSSTASPSSPTSQINLDTITGTVTEYFMIQNTGSQNITNVSLQSDNPNFSFQPSQISVLAPASQLGVQQIVALTIRYGAVTNDSDQVIGTLKAGINTATISLTGNSVDPANAPVALSETIALTAYAKLIDLNALDANGTVNLLHPWGHTSSNLEPDPYPIYPASGDSLTLVNTGNVALNLNYWKDVTGSSVDMKVGVSDSVKIPIPSTIAVDGNNVSADPSKLPTSSNGKIYASFIDTLTIPGFGYSLDQ